MSSNLLNYKGISVKKELYSIIKYIEDVDKYREELGRLSSSWDIFALLGQLGDINIDIGKTKDNFLNLTSILLNHLSEQTIKKTTAEMNFKAQVAIDIVIRNLFERTADIGFLSTDDDIRYFLENYISNYDDESAVNKVKIQKRFKEYVSKYSVYFDIVLTNTKGKILARLNEEEMVEKIDFSFVSEVLNSSDEYVETFKYHNFLPKYEKSLVYSYKVTKTNEQNSQNLGLLSLCFKFENEMKGIFKNLVDKKSKEAIMILNKEGLVIASSDNEYIPIGSKQELVLNEEYKIVSFAGRDFIAKSCKTKGYQGFNGLNWYGHIMVPLEYAFLSNDLENMKIEEDVITSMMENKKHFSKELKDVFFKSKSIQDNLNRVIWNGNIAQSKLNSSNRDFSKSLLSEIGTTGVKANSSLSNLNETIIQSILKDSEFLSSLAIDIMDRNLYERANDCRWWALTSYFKQALDDVNTLSSKKEELCKILKYINDLYTVYTNLLIFDKNLKVLAVSNKKYEYLIGKVLTQDWAKKALHLKDTSKYCVSNFEKTNLYENESTYIYCSAIRSNKDLNTTTGAIAIVFDSSFQFHAMLEETLPKSENKDDVFGFFTNKDKSIISSSNDDFKIGFTLDIDDSFFKLKNGEQISKIIVFNNSYYAVSSKCSSSYREYKSTYDDYKNDVLCFVFIKIGDINKKSNLLTKNKINFKDVDNKEFTKDCIELATFNVGNKFLAVNAKNVIECISIQKLEKSIDMDKKNHFKGMVLYKNNLISVLDIRDFINEDITNEELENIILLEYDKNNIEHCIGILVSSLENISLVKKDSIQYIQKHFLGAGTLIESLVDIKTANSSKVAMILDIKKIDTNLTQK